MLFYTERQQDRTFESFSFYFCFFLGIYVVCIFQLRSSCRLDFEILAFQYKFLFFPNISCKKQIGKLPFPTTTVKQTYFKFTFCDNDIVKNKFEVYVIIKKIY